MYEPWPDAWLINLVLHHWTNWFFYFKQLSIADNFWVRSGSPYPFPPLSVLEPYLPWTCSGLCMLLQSLWGYMYIHSVRFAGQSFLGVIHHLWLFRIFLHPLLCTSLSLKEEALMKTYCLGLRVPKSVTLFTFSSCGSLCYFWSISRRSFYDDGWSKATDLQVQQKKSFIAMFL